MWTRSLCGLRHEHKQNQRTMILFVKMFRNKVNQRKASTHLFSKVSLLEVYKVLKSGQSLKYFQNKSPVKTFKALNDHVTQEN